MLQDAEVDAHVVHLGTMGVYGYGTSGGEIPEGYLDVILPDGNKCVLILCVCVCVCVCII